MVFILLGVQGSKAQNALSAELSVPNTTNFPHLTAYLDVHDQTGAFMHGLSSQDVMVIENDMPIPVSELDEQEPGVQFVIAISSGESFTIHDALGVSRSEYLLNGLLAGTWINQRSRTDDFSLLTLGGPQVTHTSDPSMLRSSLETYLTIEDKVVPSLEVLASALQVASDPTERPGMERAILFITPPQSSEISLGLQSIIASAIKQNIHIHTWMVGSQDVFNLPETDLLRNLADQTQGTFFAFSHDEPIPDLESILEPLRYIYHLGYDSQINSAGTQQLSAQVTVVSDQVTTEPRSFEMDLQAPLPALVNPPYKIVRTYYNQPTPGITGNDADLVPEEQIFNIRVTFPDGYNRPITTTRLYVDDTLYSENKSPPYNQFVWDLRSYTQNGVHTLSVEVVDNLGITGDSGEISISIIVPTPSQGLLVVFSEKRLLLGGVFAFITIVLLVLVLILSGRIRPKPHPGQIIQSANSHKKTRLAGYHERMQKRKDSIAQPEKNTATPTLQSGTHPKIIWKERLPWFGQKRITLPAIAFLTPLIGTDEITLPAPLRIVADETRLGRDPDQSDLVIAHPSLEALHARIRHEASKFLITDNDSVAGTWVNYIPIPPQGAELEHADIIHLGEVGFRFNLAEPGPLRKIVVTPVEPEQ